MAQRGQEWVLILDFGSQYSQLIARRIREQRVYCEIWPYTRPVPEILAARPRGILLSGGPASIYEEGAPRVDEALLRAGVPVLGICYGMQHMAHSLGGRVERARRREFGRADLEVLEEGPLFAGLGPVGTRRPSWMSHGDLVLEAPPGFAVLGRTENAPVAAMGDPRRHLYGVQFHPEVAHTAFGAQLLRNFLFNVCGCEGTWTMGSFTRQELARIREQAPAGRVLVALSGGVDSAVAAALVHRAVGERLTGVFVDHGLLRAGEAEQVRETFRERMRVDLRVVEAQDRFLQRLAGVTDPEVKRRRIGEEFIRVFEEEARKVGGARYLVQGTLYPDVIESGPGAAAVIKTHHNVGGLPERMDLELIEPLRELFKDEVRSLGRELGLPEELIWRHPFPGPGLAVRIIGEVTPAKLALVRQADAIVLEELREAGLEREVWQAFAVLADTRTVGVMGDERTYGYLVAVRAVTSHDGMTADWARLPDGVLEAVSRRILNEVDGVSRVVYDISSKPPATIEWE